MFHKPGGMFLGGIRCRRGAVTFRLLPREDAAALRPKHFGGHEKPDADISEGLSQKTRIFIGGPHKSASVQGKHQAIKPSL